MKALYTIGYTKKSLRTFIDLLKHAKVDYVIDIRLNNTSQLAGFSKKEDLEFILTEGFGIGYVHVLDLAPTPEILESYKTTKDWDTYERQFRELITERYMPEILVDLVEDLKTKRPCLLCAEPEPDHCHRRLVAESVRNAVRNLEVAHL